MKSCNHNWTLYPPNQRTQYKCLKCSALGFFENHTHKIKAYRCMKPGCNEDAVANVDGVRLCIRHKEGQN